MGSEILIRVAWMALALIHLPPAGVLFWPPWLESLYGVKPEGTAGVLLRHRGALFLGIAGLATFAAVDANARRAASVAVTLSVVGFLILFARSGLPDGPLRSIALVDALALAPRAAVLFEAWAR